MFQFCVCNPDGVIALVLKSNLEMSYSGMVYSAQIVVFVFRRSCICYPCCTIVKLRTKISSGLIFCWKKNDSLVRTH